jgi:hypothetical protein
MPHIPPAEAHLRAQIAAHLSWAQTEDRTIRTASARAAFDQKFLDQAGGDPIRAEHLRKAHFAKLALKSAQARRKIKEQTAAAEAAEAELRQAGGEGR